jgi:hypothetical protein
MTSKILMLLYLTFCFGCRGSITEKSDVFVMKVSSERNEVKEFYGNYNFIVDTGNHIFYYQRPLVRSCGILHNWDTIPPFISLEPNDIVEIPLQDIEQFVKINMLHKGYTKSSSISSTLDTIRSTGLGKILRLFNDTANNVKWISRKTTIEENIVLKCKKEFKSYSPDEFKWDSTKTLFFENVEKYRNAKIDSGIVEHKNSSR